jgi:hypothetical protein
VETTVVDLGARRVERDRDRDAARRAHPALRWVAGTAFYIAHRKADGAAACGARGDLMLATPGVPLCVECYPLAERPRAASAEQTS